MPRPRPNDFMKLPDEQLSAALLQHAGLIQERAKRTKLGDDIAYLLIAAAWRIWPPDGSKDPARDPNAALKGAHMR